MKATSQPALAGVGDKLLLAAVPQACGWWASQSRQGQKGRTAAGAGRCESCRGCSLLRRGGRGRRRRHRAGAKDQQAGQHECARHAASPCHSCAGCSSQQPGSALYAQDGHSGERKPVTGSSCCSSGRGGCGSSRCAVDRGLAADGQNVVTARGSTTIRCSRGASSTGSHCARRSKQGTTAHLQLVAATADDSSRLTTAMWHNNPQCVAKYSATHAHKAQCLALRALTSLSGGRPASQDDQARVAKLISHRPHTSISSAGLRARVGLILAVC